MTTALGMPNFLGIGAARAGTTWLHENLRRHPQIWLPPAKELHYFDLLRDGPIYYSLPTGTARDWARGVKRIQRRQVLRAMFRFRISPIWAMRFFFGRRNDRWYAGLFRKGRVSGEITPGYMNLPREVVEMIHALNPNLKILMMLRNPVSRSWSAVRRQIPPGARKLRGAAMKAAQLRVLELMNSPKFMAWNDYITPIKLWREIFGENKVFIGFYDDLQAKPRELLRSVLDFLEVDSGDQHYTETLDEVINAAPKIDLPKEYLPELYAPHIEQLRELEKMFGGPVSKWLAKAEEAASMLTHKG